MSGITVITTSGNTYQVAGGAKADADPVATGELFAEVFGAKPGDGGDAPWLASFGNVEAVYVSGAVTTPSAKPSGL